MGEVPWTEPTKEEASLLLYCEARAVDHGGRLDHRNLNTADFMLLEKWKDLGFVASGRIKFTDDGPNQHASLWANLSDAAWKEASRLREARGKRVWSNRTFRKAIEDE